MRRALVVFSFLLLGLLVHAYFSTRWNPGEEFPQVVDAFEQGRRAAFAVFAGRSHLDGADPAWSTVAEERLRSLKELVVPPSELMRLADEVGWVTASPLRAEISEVELLALDVRGNTVVATYSIADLDRKSCRDSSTRSASCFWRSCLFSP